MKKSILFFSAFILLIFTGAEQGYGQAPKPKRPAVAKPVAKPAPKPGTTAPGIPAVPEAPATKILPAQISQSTLANGLNVVTVPYPSPGVVAFYIVVRVGSRNEIEAGHTGFAHFFEHMMFRGTKRFSKEQYSAVLKSTGASANANTSLDRTLYHMTGSADKLETMFDIESDRFMNLSYSLQDFKTEAGAVKGEYTKNSSNPYTKLNELIQNAAFTQHTYKHTTMGFWDDVVDMPNQYDYSLQFFSRYYRPEYCTIIVVGDAQQDIVMNLANKYFGSWSHGSYTASIPAEPEQTATRNVHLQKKGFPPYLSLNYKGPAHNDAKIDLPAIDILMSILFSENSDLYNKLVIQEQKARSIDAGAENTRDPFLISVEASVKDTGDLQYVKNELVKALQQAAVKPVDPKLLEETKLHLRNSFRMGVDNPTAIAQALSSFVWLTGDPESLNTYYDKYQKVTPQDLMYVAKKYFVPAHLTIATISPNEKEHIK